MKQPPHALVISIHDVSPLNYREVEKILKDLQSLGVGNFSLLVIPYHHCKKKISEDREFCFWLQSRYQQGDEVVLHGYEHQRAALDSDSFWKQVITSIYTAGEGEFFDVTAEQARSKLELGLHELSFLPPEGLAQLGFIAPAWLLSSEAKQVLIEEKFGYTTLLGGVLDLHSGERKERYYAAQSLVYSVRAFWRRKVSLLWNEFLFWQTRHDPLQRLSLHPPDWKYPEIRHHIFSIVERSLQDQKRLPMTYRHWLDTIS